MNVPSESEVRYWATLMNATGLRAARTAVDGKGRIYAMLEGEVRPGAGFVPGRKLTIAMPVPETMDLRR